MASEDAGNEAVAVSKSDSYDFSCTSLILSLIAWTIIREKTSLAKDFLSWLTLMSYTFKHFLFQTACNKLTEIGWSSSMFLMFWILWLVLWGGEGSCTRPQNRLKVQVIGNTRMKHLGKHTFSLVKPSPLRAPGPYHDLSHLEVASKVNDTEPTKTVAEKIWWCYMVPTLHSTSPRTGLVQYLAVISEILWRMQTFTNCCQSPSWIYHFFVRKCCQNKSMHVMVFTSKFHEWTALVGWKILTDLIPRFTDRFRPGGSGTRQ